MTTSWINQFRSVCGVNNDHAKYWFWDNFNWKKQSLWIGKFNKMNHLPSSDKQIESFLKKLINDINEHKNIKTKIYIKFYFSRNNSTKEPEINYLLICDSAKLPEEFSDTIMDVVFEKYQLTESIVNKESNFKSLINHYICWNNFYNNYDLMSELQF